MDSSPPLNEPDALRRYGIAVGCVVAGWLCREAFNIAIGPTAFPFITFFPAVAAAAWYGGLGPGLLSLVLSVATVWWAFIDPPHWLGTGKPSDAAPLAAFTISGLFIVVAFESMHRVQRRLIREGLQRQRVERQMASTLSSIGDGVIAVDVQSRVTFLNAEAERLTGWTLATAAGRPLSEVFRIVNETTREPAENPVDKVLRLGIVVGLANHTILIAKEGAQTPIDDSASPIRDADGTLFGVVLVFRDVTQHRTAARARAWLAAIVEHSGDAILTKDLHGIIQTWNLGAQRMFGYRAEEVVGKPVTILFPPDRLSEEEGILQRLRAGQFFEHLVLRAKVFHLVVQQRIVRSFGKSRGAGDDQHRRLLGVGPGNGVRQAQSADAVGDADGPQAVDPRVGVGRKACMVFLAAADDANRRMLQH